MMADSNGKVTGVFEEIREAKSAAAVVSAVTGSVGKYRWTICGLLFFATTLNYMDRQVLALLLPTLQDPAKGIGLTQVQYGTIVSAFSAAYAIGLLLAGNFIDRVGVRKGYSVAVAIWSLAAMSHFLVTVPLIASFLGSGAQTVAHWFGTATTVGGAVVGFAIVRFMLGLGESGNFPAAVKTVAEWFPKKERALATGIFNCGSNVGATVAPFLVGFVAVRFGWRYAFLCTSFFALIWLVLWLAVYRSPQDHPKVGPAELAYINSDPPDAITKLSWAKLLPHKQTWAVLFGKMLTDPIWWFYLYWLPGFLYAKYGLSILKMGLPLLIIYNVSAVGSIFGGWLPAKFLSLGWDLNKARKTAMLIYACAVVPIVAVGHASIWFAIALISLAAAAHQAWSANMFTLASDMFPRRAVGSVVGIGGFGGAVGMMIFGPLVGFILKITHNNYVPVFVISGSAYLLALLFIHALAPKLNTVSLD
jgi:MFS transporter, ACS family, aldohexuronate transporter